MWDRNISISCYWSPTFKSRPWGVLSELNLTEAFPSPFKHTTGAPQFQSRLLTSTSFPIHHSIPNPLFNAQVCVDDSVVNLKQKYKKRNQYSLFTAFLKSLHTASYIIDLRKLSALMYVNVRVHLTLFSHILVNCATNGYKAVSYTRVLLMQTVPQNKILTTRTLTMHLIYVGCTGTTIFTFQIQKVNCVVFHTLCHTPLLKNINDKPQYEISSDITTVNINTLQPRTPPLFPHFSTPIQR